MEPYEVVNPTYTKESAGSLVVQLIVAAASVIFVACTLEITGGVVSVVDIVEVLVEVVVVLVVVVEVAGLPTPPPPEPELDGGGT